MGFFDFLSSIFGGGASMACPLESTRLPVGGILSGTAKLTGAPKGVTVTDVKVKLLFVHVESQPDSAIPKIDTRMLIENTLATNVALAAKEVKEFPFTLSIPPGTAPTGNGVSYTVLVSADIPSMKDPQAKVELTIIEGAGGAAGLTAERLFSRWPALRGSEENPLVDALNDMRWKHNEGDAEDDLTVAEPILQKLMREGATPRVRRAAFEVWANIVSNHLRTEHVKLMGEVLTAAGEDRDTLREVLGAMGPTMDMGGDALVLPYINHAETQVRLAAVNALSWGRGGAHRAKALLPVLADADADVRARVVDALGNMKEVPGVLDRLIEVASTDPSGEVLKKSLGALAMCWTDKKDAPKVVAVWERARTHKDPEVRKAWVNWVSWPARQGDISPQIQAVLDDGDASVQEAMAFEFCNLLREHKQYLPLCQALITSDKSDTVKGRALGALDEALPPGEVAKVYREVLAAEPSEEMQWNMVQGIKFTTKKELKEVLLDMSRSDYGRVARAAKDAFESDYS